MSSERRRRNQRRRRRSRRNPSNRRNNRQNVPELSDNSTLTDILNFLKDENGLCYMFHQTGPVSEEDGITILEILDMIIQRLPDKSTLDNIIEKFKDDNGLYYMFSPSGPVSEEDGVTILEILEMIRQRLPDKSTVSQNLRAQVGSSYLFERSNVVSEDDEIVLLEIINIIRQRLPERSTLLKLIQKFNFFQTNVEPEDTAYIEQQRIRRETFQSTFNKNFTFLTSNGIIDEMFITVPHGVEIIIMNPSATATLIEILPT